LRDLTEGSLQCPIRTRSPERLPLSGIETPVNSHSHSSVPGQGQRRPLFPALNQTNLYLLVTFFPPKRIFLDALGSPFPRKINSDPFFAETVSKTTPLQRLCLHSNSPEKREELNFPPHFLAPPPLGRSPFIGLQKRRGISLNKPFVLVVFYSTPFDP